MIKMLLTLFLIYIAYSVIKKMLFDPVKGDSSGYPLDRKHDGADDLMIKDPECGVYFPQRQGVILRSKGETLYFCSEKCRDDYKSKNT